MMIDTSSMVPLESLGSASIEELEEIEKLADEVRIFLESQKWCRQMRRGWFDRGWGYMLSIFYFEFQPSSGDVPNSTWVVVGDIHSGSSCLGRAIDGDATDPVVHS